MLQLANGALSRVKQLASSTKGLCFHALRQLYIACVTLVLDYGSVLWQGRRGSGTLANKYQRLQNQAIILITGAYQRSPTKGLELEAAIPPTKVRMMEHAFNYTLQLLRLQNTHPVQQLLLQPLKDELNTLPEIDLRIFDQFNKTINQLTIIGNYLRLFTNY